MSAPVDSSTLNGIFDFCSDGKRPIRSRLPQNPYANVSQFSAYTLEPGEVKIGLGNILVGVLPRVQLGTSPLVDLLAPNVQGKVNFTRTGALDLAGVVQYYYLPLGEFLDLGTGTVAHASYLGLGANSSLRLADPWTAHLDVYYGRTGVTAGGALDFNEITDLVLPGLDVPSSELVGRVSGDALVLQAATDLRFNRRDSVILWVRAPVYASVRGAVSADGFTSTTGTTGTTGTTDATGTPTSSTGTAIQFDPGNLDLIVAYGDGIDPSQSIAGVLAYQASFRHLEFRLGLGLPLTGARVAIWLPMAFDVSYRFGGETRKQEKAVRQEFRMEKDQAAPEAE